VAQDPDHKSIKLSQDSDFQRKLLDAVSGPNPRSALVTASRDFIASSKFISSVSATDFQKKLNVLSAAFDKLESAGILDLKAVFATVKNVFGEDASKFVKRPEFVDLIKNLKDSIAAIKYVQVD
jgi:hypothetical protein